jgi:hypothetical protein
VDNAQARATVLVSQASVLGIPLATSGSCSVIPAQGAQETLFEQLTTFKINSAALVRKRTTPTERPPLVGEVSANFCG